MNRTKKNNSLRDVSFEGEPDLTKIPDFCWRGNLERPRLAVVTEFPTRIEKNVGVGFISPAARFCETVLHKLGMRVGNFLEGLDRYRGSSIEALRQGTRPGDVFWYHLNNDPQYDDKEQLLPSEPEKLLIFVARFHDLICRLKPKHILLLGNGAVKPILGRDSAVSGAGAVFSYPIPTLLQLARSEGNLDPWLTECCDATPPSIMVSTDMHPASVMDSDRHLRIWGERLQKVVNNLGQKVEVNEPFIKDFKKGEFEQVCNFLQSWIDDPTLEELSYDWETTSLRPCVHRDSITLSFGCARDPDHGYCIPTWHPERPFDDQQTITICQLIGKLLRKPRKATVGLNLLFDNLVSRKDPWLNMGSLPLPGVRQEVMYLAYVNDEVGPQGLKELCNIYTDIPCYDDRLENYKKEHKIKGEYKLIPLEILAPYNAYDAVANFRVRNALMAKLEKDKRGNFLDIAFKLMWLQGQALEEMAFNGQFIDKGMLFKVGREHEQKLHDAMMKLMNAPDMRDFIDMRRLEMATMYALEKMTHPELLKKFYCKKHPGTDPRPLLKRIKTFTQPLNLGQAEISQEDETLGTIFWKDGRKHEENALISTLFLDIFNDQFEFLDPMKDDLEKWKPWLKDEEYQADEEELIYYAKHAGHGYKPNFNTHGGGEMGQFFFQHLKLPVNIRSEKTEAPSLSKEARPQLIGLHPTLTDFFTYKDTVKEYSVYIKPLIKGFRLLDAGQESDEVDASGYSHLEIEIGKVVTGRTRAQRIQTFPRQGKVKLMYASRFKHGLVVQADMSQAELRVVASLANETKMIEAYKRGEDLHKKTSELLFGTRFTQCTDKNILKELRSTAKRVNFGTIYGSGPDGLVTTCKKEGAELLVAGELDRNTIYQQSADKLGLKMGDPYHYGQIEEEVDMIRSQVAKNVLDRFFVQYPALRAWIMSVHNFVLEHEYYYSPFGRIRRLPGINSPNIVDQNEAKRMAQNFPVQSAASDIAIVALAATHADFAKRRMATKSFAAVHDSLLYDAPLEEAKEVAEIVEHRLCAVQENFKEFLPDFDTSWLKVPLGADVEMGPSWGEAYPYKNGKLVVVPENLEKGIKAVYVEVADFWDWHHSKHED